MAKNKRVPKERWEWFGHPAHFICANRCQFFMATRVGKYIVSTVGEYLPDEPVREIFAQSRQVKLEGRGDARVADYTKKIGFEELGYGRKYETMVFKARKVLKSDKYQCCPWRIDSGRDFDMWGYNTAEAARAGHMKACFKYAKKQ